MKRLFQNGMFTIKSDGAQRRRPKIWIQYMLPQNNVAAGGKQTSTMSINDIYINAKCIVFE